MNLITIHATSSSFFSFKKSYASCQILKSEKHSYFKKTHKILDPYSRVNLLLGTDGASKLLKRRLPIKAYTAINRGYNNYSFTQHFIKKGGYRPKNYKIRKVILSRHTTNSLQPFNIFYKRVTLSSSTRLHYAKKNFFVQK